MRIAFNNSYIDERFIGVSNVVSDRVYVVCWDEVHILDLLAEQVQLIQDVPQPVYDQKRSALRLGEQTIPINGLFGKTEKPTGSDGSRLVNDTNNGLLSIVAADGEHYSGSATMICPETGASPPSVLMIIT